MVYYKNKYVYFLYCNLITIISIYFYYFTPYKKSEKNEFSTESKNLGIGHFFLSIFGFLKKLWEFLIFLCFFNIFIYYY